MISQVPLTPCVSGSDFEKGHRSVEAGLYRRVELLLCLSAE